MHTKLGIAHHQIPPNFPERSGRMAELRPPNKVYWVITPQSVFPGTAVSGHMGELCPTNGLGECLEGYVSIEIRGRIERQASGKHGGRIDGVRPVV